MTADEEDTMTDVTDMRGYVELLDEMGELRRLEGVDLDLEVGAHRARRGERGRRAAVR